MSAPQGPQPPPRRLRFSTFNLMSSPFHGSPPDTDPSGAGPIFRRVRAAQEGVNDDVQLVSNHDYFTPVQSESPLRRAGLLQPISHASSYSSRNMVMPHSQDTIRLNTVELSNMLMPPPLNVDASPSSFPSQERSSFIFPVVGKTSAESPPDAAIPGLRSSHSSLHSTDLSASSSSFASSRAWTRTPKVNLVSPFQPSGLSLLLAHRPESEDDSQGASNSSDVASVTESMPTPTAETGPFEALHIPQPAKTERGDLSPSFRASTPSSQKGIEVEDRHQSISLRENASDRTEAAPLLGNSYPSYSQNGHANSGPKPSANKGLSGQIKEAVSLKNLEHVLVTAFKSIPAVILGSLLNILDGVSYGMIIFPVLGVFADLGPMGVSIFFISTIIAQLVYTFGGSGFAGANGSMMIEVVPFFHILASSIAQQIGEDKPREIIATTLVAYALSSALTGVSFFLLGALKLGVIIGFFPRHILVGCIGGVGAFLIETGLTVSLRIDDDELTMTWETFKFVFLDSHNLALWAIPLGLAILLRLITHRYHHQLIFPLYFIVIPVVFYIIVAAARLDLASLRADGWVFDMGTAGQESWYKFYSYLDFGAVNIAPLWSTLPTQFALLFFNILHPPLNVPALAVSLNEDVDTDKELVAHGYSNLLSAVFGTVPNYLVYVNTLLFYRVGGGTRIAGFLLAVATAVLLFIGTGPIAFIPVMVVGALIFVLGIDLVKEALWDTRHRVSRTEYITIVSIMVAMTAWDFVIGVLFGIIVNCFFFVIQNSQRESIRAMHTGETAMSTVRRPGTQRAYIREVAKQTTILRLQGFLFFGTIASVERTIRDAIEGPSWHHNPVRFLVLDLSLVAGVDMSSAEAFLRVQRLLAAKYITLVFCGFSADSAIGKALQSVGVLGAERVDLFLTFSDALEWTENAYLRAWFRSQKTEVSSIVTLPGRQDADIVFQRSLASSPRWSHLDDAGNRTIAHETRPLVEPEYGAEPYNTLLRAFSSYGEVNSEQYQILTTYLVRIAVSEGLVLWKQNEPSDGLYIIESGILRAIYKFSDHTPSIEESMVPGTLAGELSALSSLPRNATVVVERSAVLWKLSIDNLRRLEADHHALARTFMHLVLKTAKIDYDILLSALATRQ